MTVSSNQTINSLSEELLPESCFVFKHSTRCPISFDAAEAVGSKLWQPILFWINVVEQRSLSNWISSHYNIQHESPQLIRIEKGQVVAVINHRMITQQIRDGLI